MTGRSSNQEIEMTVPAKLSVFLAATATYALARMLAPAAADGELEQAKLIIEHNATDKDTGFQVFIDGDGWERLEIVGPNGVVTEVQGRGSVNDLGLTELFFESVEPENAKLPIAQVLAMFPPGEYKFQAAASKLGGESGTLVGTARLTHKIPVGVTLVEPAEDAVLPKGDVKVRWEPSGKALDGSPVKIISYQLIIEKDEEPHPRMIGKRGLSMYLAPSVTQITIPAAFFEPETEYEWEVLAIEDSGNQTLQSSAFEID
jgi:hypothetical protein